jgi:hypothetical protein
MKFLPSVFSELLKILEPGAASSLNLATHEAEIRRIMVRSQPRQILLETLSLEKTHHKKGLMEWLKV